MKFNQFELSTPILSAIEQTGYTSATPIQQAAIPVILSNKDVLGKAQTGTGKTGAFGIPLLEKLLHEKRNEYLKALILVPTRELALQVTSSLHAYSLHTKISTVAIFGGVPQGKQVRALQQHPEILVATPGRLLDLMQQGYINLSQLKYLILDEADHMLDIGFLKDIQKIINKIPVQRQTLLFSATMPPSILQLAQKLLNNPVEIAMEVSEATKQQIEQSVYFVDKQDKTQLLIKLLQANQFSNVLVFTRTKHGADKLTKHLNKNGYEAAALHGDKSQAARVKALNAFKARSINILVATDIAARGIDIDELPYVVNYEIPNLPETYVHRIGRTGRAGKCGFAISFCDEEEKKDFKNIQKLIGFNMPILKSYN